MNSTDGIDSAGKASARSIPPSVSGADRATLSKSAEDYIAVENRLAAQRAQAPANPQFTSIFDRLRDQLPR